MPVNIIVPHLIISAFAFVLGMCVGSFANVLIYRLPKGLKFATGTSACPKCGVRIMPYDLIPIFSYFILKGRCRCCNNKISYQYPLVELVSGCTAVASVSFFGYGAEALLFFLVSVDLLVISIIDAKNMIIPDVLVVVLAVFAGAYSLFCPDIQDVGILSRLAGFFILSLPMLALTYLIPGAFGGGDIKLIAVSGFMLGARLILLAGFIAVVLGGIKGVFVKYIRKDASVSHIAFGQYICLGVFTSFIFGESLLTLYFSMILY